MKKYTLLFLLFCISISFSFSQTNVENVTVERKENGIWRMTVLQAGESTVITPDHGSPVHVMIRRTDDADQPANYWMSDVHNGVYLSHDTNLPSYTFSDCVGPLDAQVLAGVNSVGEGVEIFVRWKQPPTADLSVSHLSVGGSVSPGIATYHVGQTIDLSCYALNVGGAEAGSSKVGYYIKTSVNNTDGTPFDWNYVRSLSTGNRSRQTSTYTFTSGDAGTRYFVFEANYQNDVDEANYENNIRSFGPFEVKSPPGLSLTPSNENFGTFEVNNCSGENTFQLTNTGQTGVDVHVSLSDNEHFNINSGEGTFNLSPGETRPIIIEFCPESAGLKTEYLRVYVDGVTSPLVKTTLTGSGSTPPESIVAYTEEFTFDTRNVYSEGIFLKIVETEPDTTKKMVHKVGYRYSYYPNSDTPTSSTVAKIISDTIKFEINEHGNVFLTPHDIPDGADDMVDFDNEILLFDDEDKQIGHIAFSYSFKHEGMRSRHAIIFLHNDGEIFGGDKDDDKRFFPYHKNSPSNPPGKTYNYYQLEEYPVSMLIPPHCNTCDPGGYRFPSHYDSNPVLFVHGLTGTFSFNKKFANQKQTITKGDQVSYWFDTERKLNEMGPYHAWQFYYPNEDDLAHCGLMLENAVNHLTSKYNQPLNFVAHSMGGLVTMEYLTAEGNYNSKNIGKVLLSMSPIHGSFAANRNYNTRLGRTIDHLDNVLDHVPVLNPILDQDSKAPAYRDLSIGSKFLINLHEREWPTELTDQMIVLIGLTNSDYKKNMLTQVMGITSSEHAFDQAHREALQHSDGVTSFSSASLIHRNVGLVAIYGNHDDGKYSNHDNIRNVDPHFIPKLIDAHLDDTHSLSDFCTTNDELVEMYVDENMDVVVGEGNSIDDIVSSRPDVDYQKGLVTLLKKDDNEFLNLFKVTKNDVLKSYLLSTEEKKDSPNENIKYIPYGRFNQNIKVNDDTTSFYYTRNKLVYAKFLIKYWADTGFEFSDTVIPVLIDDESAEMHSTFNHIQPRVMQHQFFGGDLLKSAKIETSEQTPVKQFVKSKDSNTEPVSLFVDDQSSLVRFNLFSEALIYKDISYSLQIESPEGELLSHESDNVYHSRDKHTGLFKLSINDPLPGEYKVFAEMDIPAEMEYEFVTKAELGSEIKALSRIRTNNNDLNDPVELSSQLSVPDISLLSDQDLKAFIELRYDGDLIKTLDLTEISREENIIQVGNSFEADTTGLYDYTIIVEGIYNDYRFERALYGSFKVQNLSSAIVIPNQELNINNRFVELILPHYYYPAPGFEDANYEVRLDSLTFDEDDYYFDYDPETNTLTLTVEEDAPMASAWLKVNCYDVDSIVASTSFRIRYTSPGVPDNLTASDLTSSTAKLSWIPRDTESTWDIIYGPSGFDPEKEGIFIGNVSSNQNQIDYLSTGSTYEFYVRAVFDDTHGAWSWPVDFTTDHIIYAQAGNNGSISPEGEMEVSHLGFQKYNIVPDNHYHVSDVLVDGQSIGALTSYTFDLISESYTIEAEFNINSYTINAHVNEKEAGRISGGGDYEYGREVTLEAIAEDGYQFQYWAENDTQVSESPEISFTAESNRTLTAWFTPSTGLPGNSLNNIEVFPNPFNETIIIKNAGQIKQVTLVTPLGQVLLIKRLTGSYQETISTQNLPNGLYLLKIEGRYGFQTVRALIKK